MRIERTVEQSIERDILHAIPFNDPITLTELRKQVLCEPRYLIEVLNRLVARNVVSISESTPIVVTLLEKKRKFMEPPLEPSPEVITQSPVNQFFKKKSQFQDRLVGLQREKQYFPREGNTRSARDRKSFLEDIDGLLPKQYRRKMCSIPRGDFSPGDKADRWKQRFLIAMLQAYLPHGEQFAWNNIAFLEQAGIKSNYSLSTIGLDSLLAHYVHCKTGFRYVEDSHYCNWNLTLFAYYKPLVLCRETDLVLPVTDPQGRWGYVDADTIKEISKDRTRFTLNNGRECTPNSQGEVIVYEVDNHMGDGIDFLSVLRNSCRVVKRYVKGMDRESVTPLKDYYLFMAGQGIPIQEAAMLEPFIPGCYGNQWVELYLEIMGEQPSAWEESGGLLAKSHLLHRLYNEVPYLPKSLILRGRIKKAWMHLLQPYFTPLLREMAS